MSKTMVDNLHCIKKLCDETEDMLHNYVDEVLAENQTLQEALGKTFNKLADEQQNLKIMTLKYKGMEHINQFNINESEKEHNKLTAIRELCKNTLRINRGLPIDMLDDGYLLDSDTLAQRILEMLDDE